MKSATATGRVRCAIYTRVSTDQGLDQDFRAGRCPWRLLRLGHPAVQHDDVHGPAHLNVLLSFAQFEREVTSERIRDKIAASKRKGLWVGGSLPLAMS